MNKRSLLSCIIGLVWVSLLVVVLRTPVEWPIHEGKLHSATHAVHPATGVSADTPLLCVEEEKPVNDKCRYLGTAGYLAEDAKIDSLHLANRERFFGRELCSSFQNQLEPLLLNPDSVHPQEDRSVQQIEGNKVILRHEDGRTVSYAYSRLPQRTTVYYSGEQSGNELEIDEYETEIDNSAYAIEAKKGALEASYSIYRDGFEGRMARIAFCFVSCFAGLYLLYSIAPSLRALCRRRL